MFSSPQEFLNSPYFDLIFTLYAFMVGCQCPPNLNTCFQVNDFSGSCETGEVRSSWQEVGHQQRASSVITHLGSDLVHRDVNTHMTSSNAWYMRMWTHIHPVPTTWCTRIGCEHTYSQFPSPDPPGHNVNTHAISSHHLIHQGVDTHTASFHYHRPSCPSHPFFPIVVDL